MGPDVERHFETVLEALRQQFRKRINPRRRVGWDGEFAWGSHHWLIFRFLHTDPVKIPAVDDFDPKCHHKNEEAQTLLARGPGK
jgi:hypothetical protein